MWNSSKFNQDNKYMPRWSLRCLCITYRNNWTSLVKKIWLKKCACVACSDKMRLFIFTIAILNWWHTYVAHKVPLTSTWPVQTQRNKNTILVDCTFLTHLVENFEYYFIAAFSHLVNLHFHICVWLVIPSWICAPWFLDNTVNGFMVCVSYSKDSKKFRRATVVSDIWYSVKPLNSVKECS